MRIINYEKIARGLIDSDIYNMLFKLHESKGRLNAYIDIMTSDLKSFELSAKLQGIEAMNNTFGNFIASKSIEELYLNRNKPRNEKEIFVCGYRDVISIATNNYARIIIMPEFIDRLAMELSRYEDKPDKKSFYSISSPLMTNTDLENIDDSCLLNICQEYNREAAISEFDVIVLISIFLCDFINIKAYNNATFPLAFCLLNILLCKNGYMIGKYISLEKILIDRVDEYRNMIAAITFEQNAELISYKNSLKLVINVVIIAYNRFFELLKISQNRSMSKPEKIAVVIECCEQSINKKEIMELCPDISVSTIEHTLNKMLENGLIEKVGGGRSTAYKKTNRIEKMYK